MAKAKLKSIRDDIRNAVIDECAKAVPMNWCDGLLSGPSAPRGPFDARDVERLLRGIQERIRSLKAAQQPH